MPVIDAISSNFWVIAGAILLACFAGFIAYRNGKINRAAEAGKALRAAFEGELHIFEHDYSLTGHMLHGVLINSYSKHRIAVQEFRRHLSIIDRIRLDRVWGKYHGGNEHTPHFLPYYIGDNSRQNFVDRVHDILALTKKT